MPTKIGNIKIQINSVIQYYWRLNYFTGGIPLEGQQVAENLSPALVKSSNMNNLFVEDQFEIVSNDTVNNVIELSSTIPDKVFLPEAFSQAKGWVATKDDLSMLKIDEFLTDNTFHYIGDGIGFAVGEAISLLNPFSMYGINGSSPVLDCLIGDWCEDGVIPQFIYKTPYNTFIMGFKGIQSSVNKFGLASSSDLEIWSVMNSGEPVVVPGSGNFSISRFVESDSIIEFAGNPFVRKGDFVMFFVSDNRLGYITFTYPFNITYISEKIDIPFVSDSNINYLTQCELNGNYYLFVTTENEEVIKLKVNINSMTLEYINGLNFIGFENSWVSGGISGLSSFVYNNLIHLFITGKSNEGLLTDIYTSGLIIVNDNFDVKEFNPILIAPLNGGIDWGYPGAQGDFSGKFAPIINNEILYVFPSIRDFSDLFNIWDLMIPLNPSEPV